MVSTQKARRNARKKIDKLVDYAKDYGAKGLAYIAIHEDGTVKSSFAKFMTEDEQKAAELLKNRHRLSVEVESKNIKRLISDGLKAHIEIN